MSDQSVVKDRVASLAVLEKIPLPDKDIDPGIANLVRALNLNDIKTKASCEGHLNREHVHPWVACWTSRDVKTEFIEGFNSESEAKWTVLKLGGHKYVEPLDVYNCDECHSVISMSDYHLAAFLASGRTAEGIAEAAKVREPPGKEKLHKQQQSAEALALYLVRRIEAKGSTLFVKQ